MELCHVPPGQLARKRIPQDQISDILQFSTMKPHERIRSIHDGLGVCSALGACRFADKILQGAAIWTIAIRSPIRHERF